MRSRHAASNEPIQLIMLSSTEGGGRRRFRDQRLEREKAKGHPGGPAQSSPVLNWGCDGFLGDWLLGACGAGHTDN